MTALSLHPAIFIAPMDHGRLFATAERHACREPDVANFLMRELERARRMRLTAKGTSSECNRMCAPRRIDRPSPQGSASILKSVGTALIELKEGQSIRWKEQK